MVMSLVRTCIIKLLLLCNMCYINYNPVVLSAISIKFSLEIHRFLKSCYVNNLP